MNFLTNWRYNNNNNNDDFIYRGGPVFLIRNIQFYNIYM